MSHTVILSDVHLSEAVPAWGKWLLYRQAEHFPDRDLADFLDDLRTRLHTELFEVVFNGDIFDFDAPTVEEGNIKYDFESHTPEGAAVRLERILDDHGVFVEAVGRLLAAGHRVVFIAGNHDASLVFCDAQNVLYRRLTAIAQKVDPGLSEAQINQRLVFREWFYTTESGVHIEHGHQYDQYCAFQDPVRPFLPDGSRIRPTFGSLTFRNLVSRLGYSNPFVDGVKLRSSFQYVMHGVRHYWISRHAAVTGWIWGSLKTIAAIRRVRKVRQPSSPQEMVIRAAAAVGAQPERLRQHFALFAAPLDTAMRQVVRALWLDRFAFVALILMLSIVAAYFGYQAALATAGIGIAAMVVYESLMPSVNVYNANAKLGERARAIAEIHQARGVVFGHTHVPMERWLQGVFFGNSGSWSGKEKTVIWLKQAGSALSGGLHIWRKGTLEAYKQKAGSRKQEA